VRPPIVYLDSWQARGRIVGGYPKTHRYAYRLFERDLEVWAWPGLYLVLRAANWYRSHRWTLERWGTWRRYKHKKWFCFVVKEGDYYSNGHWVIRHV